MSIGTLTHRMALIAGAALLAFLATGSNEVCAAKKLTSRESATEEASAMVVVVARSSEVGCEPVCAEWISAKGTITSTTTTKFRAIFRQAKGKPLPVVIDSLGGSVEAAIEIGKMIRRNKSPVLVGDTWYTGCNPAKSACFANSKTQKPYFAEPNIRFGFCTSACGFILAGGVSRMAFVDGIPLIGTHQVFQPGYKRERVRYLERYIVSKGRKKLISRKVISRKAEKVVGTTKLPKAYVRYMRNYFINMGVDAGYLALFEKAKPNSMYFLTRDEQTSTRIITNVLASHEVFGKALCMGDEVVVNCIKR
jgi:hypothetical protein